MNVVLETYAGAFNILRTPGDISVEQALTIGDAGTRCAARLFISSGNEQLVAFFNAEMELGTDPNILLSTLWRYFIQFHASMAALVFEVGSGSAVERHMRHAFEELYLAHFTMSQEAQPE